MNAYSVRKYKHKQVEELWLILTVEMSKKIFLSTLG